MYNQKFKQNYFMSEQEKLDLIRRKNMLFLFLRSMQKNKDKFAENDDDFNVQVDFVLDQIIRINYKLNHFNYLY